MAAVRCASSGRATIPASALSTAAFRRVTNARYVVSAAVTAGARSSGVASMTRWWRPSSSVATWLVDKRRSHPARRKVAAPVT